MGPHRLGAKPSDQEAGKVAEGELVVSSRHYDQLVRAIGAFVLMPVSGIGAGQGAERQQPRHEAEIGVRFAGPDKLVHLIGLGEVVDRLG